MGMLDGKVAIITGSGRGIGRAAAEIFSEQGADVVICDLDAGPAEETASIVRANGRKALVCAGNLVDPKQPAAIMAATAKEFGRLDILVNNAGYTADGMLHKMTDEQWDQVIEVNLKGVFLCTQCAVQVMREKGYGKIINISSSSWRGNPGQINYSATKAGVIGMTKTAAKELAPKGINVNVIAPAMIWTDMIKSMPPAMLERLEQMLPFIVPLNRWGAPRDIANLALFLASDESSFITGQLIHCDGGMIM